MNPLIKKEIRLLMPAWIGAMLLAVLPVWILDTALLMNPDLAGWVSRGVWSFCLPLIFSLGVLFLGITSFGQELNSGAFALLLSQPAERRRIWRIKITVLTVAFVTVWLAAAVFILSTCFVLQRSLLSGTGLKPNVAYEFEFLTLSALVTFSGGLWTTLLLRQITGAFWFTLLTPLALFMAINIAANYWGFFDQNINAITIIVLSLYSFAAFFGAWKLFLRAQDTQWTGGELSFSWHRGRVNGETAASLSSPRHWLLALLRKEILLHQVTFFIAIIVLALHLCSLFIRKIHPHFNNPDAEFVLEAVWSLWLLMPLLIASAVVAEERKLGVAESQLCLPVSRRLQFFIKFSVALILSLFLGAVMPSLLEGTRDFGQPDWPHDWIVIPVLALFFVSIYASTLSRSTLQAMGIAIALPLVMGIAVVAFICDVEWVFRDSLYRGMGLLRCALYFGVPILLLVLARLMFWNYRWLHQNSKLWRRNLAIVIASFIFVCLQSCAIYWRAWEWVMPVEPAHAAARLGAESSVTLQESGNTLVAVTPGGKMWSENLGMMGVGFGNISPNYWQCSFPLLDSQRFADGSNWRAVSPGASFILGIRSDGSLWAMPQFHEKLKTAQIGSDTNWIGVASHSRSFLLLKKDGSLWAWGTSGPDAMDRATLPVRISDETNWTALLQPAFSRGLAQKKDGSLWTWVIDQRGYNHYFNLVHNTNWSNEWISYADRYPWAAGIKTNGDLWLLYKPSTNWYSDGAWIPAYTKAALISTNSIWKAVTFSTDSAILLARDGTLWKWDISPDFPLTGGFSPGPFHPIRLGHHSDWIALSSHGWDGIGIALAADGSLWEWDAPSDRIWLAPSRRPAYFGNIFQSQGRNE